MPRLPMEPSIAAPAVAIVVGLADEAVELDVVVG